MTQASPERTLPSRGITLPVWTQMVSPAFTWVMGTSTSVSDLFSHTRSTFKDIQRARSPRDFFRVHSSSSSPSRSKNMTEAAVL